MLKSTLLLGLLGSLCLAGCNSGIDGNGERAEEQRTVQSFSRIRSDCDLDVEVTQGAAPALTVSIDSNLMRLVDTSVVDDTLYIDVREDLGDVISGPNIRVTVPTLSAAKLAGSGRLNVFLDEPEQPLDLYLTGSGDVRFEGRSAALSGDLSGSGDMRFSGEASDVDLQLSGSGAIRAANLVAPSGNVELSGSGDVSANVTDSVRVSLSGSGHIDLYGGAKVEQYRSSGSGEIEQH